MTTEAMGISRQFNEFYIKEKINNFAATPYIFQMLRKVGFWDGTKEEYLHRALAAGEKMPEEEYKSLHAIIRDKLWIAYGQTESTGFISAINFQKKYEDMLSVGKAFNHVEIVPDGGKGEMFTGGKLSTSGEMFTSGEMSTSGKLSTSGELCINSKSVCMGYAVNAEQLSDGDVNNGLLHTGDAVYIDDDGYIFLRGRLTRYAKILGKRVSLDDVEMYLNNKYKNAEFACTGTDNAISVFYAKAESNLNEEIPALLDRSMKIPKKFISCLYMERIPRTGAGKIAYAALEQL